MNRTINICILLFAAGLLGAGQNPETAEYVPPALGPAPYLIRDPAVRMELNLTAEQTALVRDLCDQMDQPLFALRDAPPKPTDPASIRHIQDVEKIMKGLPNILIPTQQQRLWQLSFQYEGAMALFRAESIARLQITPAQQQQMQILYRQSLQQQEQLRQDLREASRQTQLAQEIQQVQFHLAQQLLKVLNESQFAQWQETLGRMFDFSRTQPLSFRAPELQEVTAWLNTKPLSMEALRGRVIVLHFWAFGCGDCMQNYPIYKMWTRQYDPKEVLVLGIHTPETESEKDLQALRQKAEQEGLTFPIAVDNSKANWQAWSNRVRPSVYLVDKNGRVRCWWYGDLRWQDSTGDQWMSQRIEQLRTERFNPLLRKTGSSTSR